MKSSINTPAKPTFPFLGQLIGSSGFVILFTAPRTGTVVNPGGTSYGLGYHADCWDTPCYVPLVGAINLEN